MCIVKTSAIILFTLHNATALFKELYYKMFPTRRIHKNATSFVSLNVHCTLKYYNYNNCICEGGRNVYKKKLCLPIPQIVKHRLYTMSLFIHGLSDINPSMILPNVLAMPNNANK